MKTIAFFNNKGGVGKTSLVYHLACMFADLDYKVIAADLDPQANLSGMFLEESRLERIWEKEKEKTVYGSIAPLFKARSGDMTKKPSVLGVHERIGLLVGDLRLSTIEDDLSAEWPRCLVRNQNERALRFTASFAEQIAAVGARHERDLALLDVGPNLGAINRSALIASDYVVIPLAPDLFSLQGLRNVGPTLREWHADWIDRIERKPDDLSFKLPGGCMQPLGYVVMRHTAIRNRPVKAYLRWIEKMPAEYAKHVLEEEHGRSVPIDADSNCLAHLKDYRSLMPLAQEANKPMFALKPADGVIGAQQNAVRSCYKDFRNLAEKILDQINKAK